MGLAVSSTHFFAALLLSVARGGAVAPHTHGAVVPASFADGAEEQVHFGGQVRRVGVDAADAGLKVGDGGRKIGERGRLPLQEGGQRLHLRGHIL